MNKSLNTIIYYTCTAISALAISIPSAEANSDRYLWIEVPYKSNSPGMTFGGETNCYGSSTSYNYGAGSAQIQPYGYGARINGSSSNFGGSSGSANCSKNPTYYIPPSESQSMLRVHIDCKDQTYDAKGDMMGWQSWRKEPAVYERAIAACSNKSKLNNLSDLRERFTAAKKENEALIAKSDALYKQGTFTYEQCIKYSLKSFALWAPFAALMKPEYTGLTTRAQVVRYLSKSKSTISDGCRKMIQMRKDGSSLEEVKLMWDKNKSEIIESIISNSP